MAGSGFPAEMGSKKPLAVGDRLNTDIAGGNAAAMNTFHVLTGVSGEKDRESWNVPCRFCRWAPAETDYG